MRSYSEQYSLIASSRLDPRRRHTIRTSIVGAGPPIFASVLFDDHLTDSEQPSTILALSAKHSPMVKSTRHRIRVTAPHCHHRCPASDFELLLPDSLSTTTAVAAFLKPQISTLLPIDHLVSSLRAPQPYAFSFFHIRQYGVYTAHIVIGADYLRLAE
jgi:hypothetical protein